VHQALQALQAQDKTAAPQAPVPGAGPRVHLLMTEADRAAAVPLVVYAHGFTDSSDDFGGSCGERHCNWFAAAESRQLIFVSLVGDLGGLEQADALVVEAALEGLFCVFFLCVCEDRGGGKRLRESRGKNRAREKWL
jgi:hypothetical protein